jgi:predicted  nucleic acid-binding Zn-ribbon protein
MHDSFETACEHLEKEKEDLQLRIQALEEDLQARDTDVANANKDVDQLGQRVFDLEEDLEHVRARAEQEIGEAIDRAQLHEEMCDSLKEVSIHLLCFLTIFSLLDAQIAETRYSAIRTHTRAG